jgi:hypothetical protein
LSKPKPPQLHAQDVFLYTHENGAITFVPASHRSQFVTLADAIAVALRCHEDGGVVFLGSDDAGLGASARMAIVGLGVEIVPYESPPPYRWNDGTTALMSAAALGRDAILGDLINRGADVDQLDDSGATALHHAALAGNLHAIDALVDAGADVEMVSGKGFTPYDLALTSDQPEAAQRLAEYSARTSTSPGSGETAGPVTELRFHRNHHLARFIWLVLPAVAVFAVPLLWAQSVIAALVPAIGAIVYVAVLPRTLWIGGAPRRLRGDTLVLKRLSGREFEVDLREVTLAGFGGLERRRGRGPRWLLLMHPSGHRVDRREIQRLSVRSDEADILLHESGGIVLVDIDEARRHEVILAVGNQLTLRRIKMLPSLVGQLAAARRELAS